VFWIISVYFNIRNTLPKSGTFLLGHPVYIYIYIYIYIYTFVGTHKQLTHCIITKTRSKEQDLVSNVYKMNVKEPVDELQ